MDFAFTEDDERFRAELRAFLAEELPAWWRGSFLEAHELSRRKLPERLEVVGELPVTASGKVQKHVLRERIARLRAEKPA